MTLQRTAIALWLLMSLGLAQAAAVPAHILQELPEARLSGQGSYRWFGLKIYDASLWVGDTGYQAAAPTRAKFVLDLNYARELYGERIAKASIEEITELGIGTAAQHEIWLNKMKALFPDVRVGNHISGVYLPDIGARFYLDGKLLGVVADPDFARAFFAIWLDPRTSAASLRSKLLPDAP